MPRRSLALIPLAAFSLLITSCDRRATDGAGLSTNVVALTDGLNSRDPERREIAARLIAEYSIPVKSRDLIRVLDDSNPSVRRYGAEALGKQHAREALKPLFRLLQDDNWYVRAEAAAAMGRIGDPRAAGWLIQLLNDSDSYVRLCAGSALREVTTSAHRELLLGAFGQAHPQAKPNLAIALAKLHEPSALPVITSVLQTNDVVLRRRAVEALGDFAAAAVTNSLVALLNDQDSSVREEAKRSLQRLHDDQR